MAGLGERLAVAVDLLGLQVAQGLAGRLGDERGTHQVHALLGGPHRGVAGAGTPPDALAQPGSVGLDAELLARTELARVRIGEALAVDRAQEQVELVAGDVRATGIGRAGVAERLPAAQGRLWGAAADADRDALVGEQVEAAQFLGEVQRVLVAHVDDAGAHLDVLRAAGDGGEERHRGGGLAGEVVHPKVGAVDAELVRAAGDLQGVLEHALRVRTLPGVAGVVAETEESESLHAR